MNRQRLQRWTTHSVSVRDMRPGDLFSYTVAGDSFSFCLLVSNVIERGRPYLSDPSDRSAPRERAIITFVYADGRLQRLSFPGYVPFEVARW